MVTPGFSACRGEGREGPAVPMHVIRKRAGAEGHFWTEGLRLDVVETVSGARSFWIARSIA